MDINTAERELLTRLYHWALQENQHQVELDYTLLRTVQNEFAFLFPDVMQAFPLEDRLKLAVAQVKQFYYPILESVQVSEQSTALLTVDEKELLAHITAFLQSQVANAQYPFFRCDPAQEKCQRPNGRKLLAAVIDRLKPIFGETLKRDEDIGWNFHTFVYDWDVVTHIEGSYAGFQVYQAFFNRRDDCRDRNIPKPWSRYLFLDYIGSIGYGAGAGSWSIKYERDIEKCVNSAALISNRVMQVLPKLLEGFGPDD